MDNLWPEFDDIEKAVTPGTILREQARALGLKFRQRIEGEVRIERYEKVFSCTFLITSKPLSYSYELFKVEYGLFEIYPAAIILEGDLAEEIACDKEEIVKCDDEAAFIDTVKKIFVSKKTQKIIKGLSQHLS